MTLLAKTQCHRHTSRTLLPKLPSAPHSPSPNIPISYNHKPVQKETSNIATKTHPTPLPPSAPPSHSLSPITGRSKLNIQQQPTLRTSSQNHLAENAPGKQINHHTQRKRLKIAPRNDLSSSVRELTPFSYLII